MITWLQRALMKNGKWVFSILLVIVIVSFVFTINVAGGMGSSRDRSGPQMFYGVNFASAREMRDLQFEVELSQWLSTGRQAMQGLEIGDLTRRVALRHLADTLGLPGPTAEQKATFIRSRPLFRGPQGNFSQDAYQAFLDRVQTSMGVQLDFLAHVLAEDYRLQQVERLLGGPGYVQDFEVRRMVEDLETRRTALVATIPFADFQPGIEVEDEALQEFYASRPDTWAVPEMASVQLIRFRASQFMAEVQEPKEDELVQYFNRNIWRFRARTQQPTVEGEEPKPPADPVLEDHRDEVVRLVREEKARGLALAATDRFSMRLYRERVMAVGKELDALVAEMEAQAVDLAPYARGSTPAGAPVPLAQPALQQIFELPTNRIFGDIMPLADGGGVLVLRELAPARVRPLDEVRELVEADYRDFRRRELYDLHGQSLREQLLAAVQAGGDFRAAAEEAGLSVVEFAEFTAQQPPQGLEPAVGLALGRLGVGEITPMVIPAEGASGKLAYLAASTAPDPDALGDEIAMYRQQLLFFARSLSAQGLLAETERLGSRHLH